MPTFISAFHDSNGGNIYAVLAALYSLPSIAVLIVVRMKLSGIRGKLNSANLGEK